MLRKTNITSGREISIKEACFFEKINILTTVTFSQSFDEKIKIIFSRIRQILKHGMMRYRTWPQDLKTNLHIASEFFKKIRKQAFSVLKIYRFTFKIIAQDPFNRDADPDPGHFRIFLRIQIQEAKILRMQRIRILSTCSDTIIYQINKSRAQQDQDPDLLDPPHCGFLGLNGDKIFNKNCKTNFLLPNHKSELLKKEKILKIVS